MTKKTPIFKKNSFTVLLVVAIIAILSIVTLFLGDANSASLISIKSTSFAIKTNLVGKACPPPVYEYECVDFEPENDIYVPGKVELKITRNGAKPIKKVFYDNWFSCYGLRQFDCSSIETKSPYIAGKPHITDTPCPNGHFGGACLEKVTECGDGNIDINEECDDGNKNDKDGCSNKCKINSCTEEIIDGVNSVVSTVDWGSQGFNKIIHLDGTVSNLVKPKQLVVSKNQCRSYSSECTAKKGQQYLVEYSCSGTQKVANFVDCAHGCYEGRCLNPGESELALSRKEKRAKCGDGTTQDWEECDTRDPATMEQCRCGCKLIRACEDSDNGKTPSIKGTITSNKKFKKIDETSVGNFGFISAFGVTTSLSGEKSNTASDFCNPFNEAELFEYYCHRNKVEITKIICKNGCVGGRCLNSDEVFESAKAEFDATDALKGSITNNYVISGKCSDGTINEGEECDNTNRDVCNANCTLKIKCSDTDKGNSPFVKGNITLSEQYKGLKSATDYCDPDTPNILYEYVCSTVNGFDLKEITCKAGCNDGRCNEIVDNADFKCDDGIINGIEECDPPNTNICDNNCQFIQACVSSTDSTGAGVTTKTYGNTVETITDICGNNHLLKKYSCSIQNNIIDSTVECSEGCFDGRCLVSK